MVTFNKWCRTNVDIDNGAIYCQEWTKKAWDYQQAIIDKLENDIKELTELGTDQAVTERILKLEKSLEKAEIYIETLHNKFKTGFELSQEYVKHHLKGLENGN